MKLAELARHLNAALEGDGEIEISGVASIKDAGAGQLTFIADPKYAPLAQTTKASVVVVEPEFPAIAAATLRIKNPYLAFARALALFYQPPQYAAGVHPTAVIDATAKIGAGSHVGAYVVVGAGVVIGENATLLPHVVIYPGVEIGRNFFAHAHAVVREHCKLGDDVTLQNGAIIGADGFGFAKDADGWHKIPQSGHVVMGRDVEVQANACVDRATLGETRVDDGVKIDNLTQVGHGSEIGERSLLCAQVGLAGSTILGKDVILAGQVGAGAHCTIGDGVIATGQSGIKNDIEPGLTVTGYYAVESKKWLRSLALFYKLPEIVKELRKKKEE
jgi:UDP-3-O-[3-hydroxymyristoyl] glucosamine N-acyltransferase